MVANRTKLVKKKTHLSKELISEIRVFPQNLRK